MTGPAATVPCPACDGRAGPPRCETCGGSGEATDEAVAALAGPSDACLCLETFGRRHAREEDGGRWRCVECDLPVRSGLDPMPVRRVRLAGEG
jgi:hypothetical protein